MRLQTAPMGYGSFDGEALLNLAQIDEILKIHRKAEIAKHRLRNPGVAASILLVAFHHRGRNVEILWVGKTADHIH